MVDFISESTLTPTKSPLTHNQAIINKYSSNKVISKYVGLSNQGKFIYIPNNLLIYYRKYMLFK